MGVDDTVISWITDYLTGRPQFVCMGSVLSDAVVSDTGAPQGTVLSPFLFTFYTTDLSTATPTDSTNSSWRLALWLAVNRTLWRLWWRGGHWKNCYPSWIILSTLSNSHWSDSGAPSPEGCFSFTVVTTDTGNLSCHKPSLYIITLSPLPDRDSSDLSTVLLYVLLLFIVYFALYISFADPLLPWQNNFPVWDQ